MHTLIKKPAHYYNAPRREMLPFIPMEAGRILEIGCGEGRFGAELKRVRSEMGITHDVTGVELDSERAKVAIANLNRVIVANVEQDELGLTPESFDCIVCNDVLEHLVSPWRVLESLKGLLAPGGCLVASIPNVRYWGVLKDLLLEGEWRYADEGVLDATHLRFFTRRSIARMFEESGYKCETLDGINSRVRGWKFDILRMVSGGRLNDIQFLQFVVVARRLPA
jgi:2-polyprenyl-3-methyl-5-hydroxy-6-metoxy-1,4-benzoquinol methylase